MFSVFGIFCKIFRKANCINKLKTLILLNEMQRRTDIFCIFAPCFNCTRTLYIILIINLKFRYLWQI